MKTPMNPEPAARTAHTMFPNDLPLRVLPSDYDSNRFYILTKDRVQIATVNCLVGKHYAKLFASAPTLAADLAAAVEALEAIVTLVDRSPDRHLRAYDQARAVLAQCAEHAKEGA